MRILLKIITNKDTKATSNNNCYYKLKVCSLVIRDLSSETKGTRFEYGC